MTLQLLRVVWVLVSTVVLVLLVDPAEATA
jgi:hypothetical protein